MKSTVVLPPFATTQVGSWPRSDTLLGALREKRHGRLDQAGFDAIADAEIRRCVRHQLDAGMDIIVDGELRRDNFYSFLTDKVEGTRLMSLAEMLDTVEDKAAFEEMLTTLDAPAYAIRNPTCVGPLRRRSPLVADDLRFMRSLTDRPAKVTLPGPYLLTRAMWVTAHTQEAYPDKTAMGEAVVGLLRDELADLAEVGSCFVQFDEPVLTEVALSTNRNKRTFMCATLATRSDPSAELAYAVELFNRVVEGASPRLRIGLHVCRGNWSRREDVLLSGDYVPLAGSLAAMHADQFVLEYATPRAGELAVAGRHLSHAELGLGCLNPRTASIEAPADIIARAEEALAWWEPSQIFLNPDCGFGCFSSRCVNDEATAAAKLHALAAAARALRERWGAPGE